ncbi:MAG: pyridoxamine 5'-phosphate oxidase family protein [Acidimicrobiaceae bacterium]|nr:pyridoxamine 5'-phosphate oxidase family protein [Acidimicrobiaceae bacterium]
MTRDQLGPGPLSRVRRLPKKAAYDSKTIYSILDEARFCHVSGIVNGRAMALPTLHAREGDVLYLHGSQSNALMRSIVERGEASITVTLYDGLRLARSGFESSVAYRSAVVFGAVSIVDDPQEKLRILETFVDAVLPGRSQEVRSTSEQELRLTLVVAVSIDEASAKVSAGPTDDPEEDLELPIWSGTVPARLVFEAPIPTRNGAMVTGDIELPGSVRALLERS